MALALILSTLACSPGQVAHAPRGDAVLDGVDASPKPCVELGVEACPEDRCLLQYASELDLGEMCALDPETLACVDKETPDTCPVGTYVASDALGRCFVVNGGCPPEALSNEAAEAEGCLQWAEEAKWACGGQL